MHKYQKNPLSTVIFRVDFVNKINVENDTLIKECMAIYPVVQTETINEQNVTTKFDEKGEMSVDRSTNTFINKKYSNRQLTRNITISPKYILAEVKDYSSYEDIIMVFQKIFNTIRNTTPDSVIARIGMRYINNIDLSNYKRTALRNYVSSSLFESLYDGAVIGSSINRTQHLTELAIDDYRVRCVTGLFNPDYPSTIKRNIITLDFDAFIQGNVDSSEVTDYLNKFHETIQTLFEKSILSKQRDLMGIIENE